MADAVTLRDRHWNVVLAPTHGGSIRHCAFDGIAVLEPVAALERIGGTPRSCCYFPMIPFANRIQDGQFRYGGAKVCAVANVAGTRHAIHGHGWQCAWEVTERNDTACAMVYRRDATSDWPWRYEGRQVFEIRDESLRIMLVVRNLSARPMPCGLGLHPFFPAKDGASLQLEAERIWNGHLREFPRERIPVPPELSFGANAPVSGRVGTDHCYDGWRGRAVVTYANARPAVVIEGDEAARFVVVYVPGSGYFCVEPVTHAANAINFPDPATAGLWSLAPAESRALAASISLTTRD
jgi:aldose 1-epimerase